MLIPQGPHDEYASLPAKGALGVCVLMATPIPNPGSYHVGWICAVRTEYVAACELLDEEFQTPVLPQNDHNAYTCGRIGKHKVVVACLPQGKYGVASAATVAKDLLRSFQAIQFGLMVGIGGGAPSAQHDIRLGDVVVSSPTGRTGGVIHYEFGKTIQDQKFDRTGSLTPPPPFLLTALQKLSALHERRGHGIAETVNQMVISNARLKRYQHPDPRSDVLYASSFVHADEGQPCGDICGTEDDRIVQRPARDPDQDDPVIHYGLIASADRLMNDAHVRDHLAQTEGVLCFEMEAAGLMDHFPCLVIRGICDYSDTHKNDLWQGYAAATAAAYAKELLQIAHKETTTSRTACWSVPLTRNQRFVGRDLQLSELEAKLFCEGYCPRVAITGLGGVGKTQIVLELAYRTRDSHPNCSVFWVPATSLENIQQAYLEMARQLQIQVVEKKQDVIKLVQDALSQESAGQWLLILDSADDIDLWLNDMDMGTRSTRLIDCLPKSNNGSIVFTTRTRKAAVKFAPAIIHVPEKDEEVATQILKKSLNNPEILDHPAMSDFLSKLTFLPLAIIQAAAYINENDISLQEYLSLWDDAEENIVEVLSEDFEDEGRYRNQKNPVATTWLISFEQVRRRDVLAAKYLSFMSCLDPKMIPQSLLPPAESKREALEAIGTLTAYSFIAKQKDHTFDLHRLVHLATRSWLREQKSLTEWIRKATARLADVFPDDNPRNRTLWRAYLPHARSLLSSSLEDDGFDGRLLLLERFGLCLLSDGRYFEAEDPLVQVMEKRKRVLGPVHLDTLTSMGNLASTLWNQGRWTEAEELDVQVVETTKRVLGPEHPGTLSSMGNLASTYRDQGRWTEAEELEAQVVETRKRVLGPEHPSTLVSIGNLASTYRNQGRWKEAEELEAQVVETTKRVLGPEHPDTLTSMGNLASTYRNQGRWKEAEELEAQGMETRKRMLGPEHPGTLTSMASLASTYRNQGRWKEAEELDVQVVETRKRVLGREHPSTLTSMAHLASTLWNQGRWKEAEELEVQVVETTKRVLGPEHPSTLVSMGNLASTHRHQGRWKEAEELEVQMVETRKRVLGTEHPDTLTSMTNLASTYSNQGRWKEAEELEAQVVKTRKRVLGPEHPHTLISMGNLASTFWNQGRWKEAEELEVQVMETRKRVLGQEHPDTLTSIANLASTYMNQGRWKEAEEFQRQAMETTKRVLGPEHPSTLTIMANLASTYMIQGRWTEAEELEVQVMEMIKRVLGPEHPSTLTIMDNLALTYMNQGRWKEAEELQGQVMETRKRVLGPEHPDTLACVGNLALTYRNRRGLKEAEELERDGDEKESAGAEAS